MVPEILIVGDETRRAGLLRRIRALGYDVSACAVRELNRRVRAGSSPAVIVLCIADANPAVVMAGLRRTRQGAAIPVILLGQLGGEVRDLADVLDLGADHFIEDDAEDNDLAAALEELAGPVVERTDANLGPPGGGNGTDREPWSPPKSIVEGNEGAGTGGTDPSISQLHRTLDMLEARLRRRDADEGRPNEDADLDSLGLDSVPEVDGPEEEDFLDASESHDVMRLVEVGPGLGPASARAEGAPETTERLSVAGSSPTGSRSHSKVAASPEALPNRRRASATLPTEPRGSLSVLSLPRLLFKLHRARFGGKVSLARGRVRKQIWMADGAVLFARSNLSQDRLVDGLLRRGRLTRSQYEAARRLAAKEPRRAGQILVEAGFIKSSELHGVLREHLASVVDSAFEWPEGDWRVTPDETCDEPVVLDVPTPRLIVQGIRRRLEPGDILGDREVYPRLSGRVGAMPGGLAALADELDLGPDDVRILERLDGSASLGDLAALDPDVPTLIDALDVLELVDLAGEPAASSRRQGSASGVDQARIEERLGLARDADYFALLGLRRNASRSDVRRAYAELDQTFDDEVLELETRGTMEPQLRELRAALEEAYAILSDDALRSAYLAHLEDA